MLSASTTTEEVTAGNIETSDFGGKLPRSLSYSWSCWVDVTILLMAEMTLVDKGWCCCVVDAEDVAAEVATTSTAEELRPRPPRPTVTDEVVAF